jgi:hypothetical protein
MKVRARSDDKMFEALDACGGLFWGNYAVPDLSF